MEYLNILSLILYYYQLTILHWRLKIAFEVLHVMHSFQNYDHLKFQFGFRSNFIYIFSNFPIAFAMNNYAFTDVYNLYALKLQVSKWIQISYFFKHPSLFYL